MQRAESQRGAGGSGSNVRRYVDQRYRRHSCSSSSSSREERCSTKVIVEKQEYNEDKLRLQLDIFRKRRGKYIFAIRFF